MFTAHACFSRPTPGCRQPHPCASDHVAHHGRAAQTLGPAGKDAESHLPGAHTPTPQQAPCSPSPSARGGPSPHLTRLVSRCVCRVAGSRGERTACLPASQGWSPGGTADRGLWATPGAAGAGHALSLTGLCSQALSNTSAPDPPLLTTMVMGGHRTGVFSVPITPRTVPLVRPADVSGDDRLQAAHRRLCHRSTVVG